MPLPDNKLKPIQATARPKGMAVKGNGKNAGTDPTMSSTTSRADTYRSAALPPQQEPSQGEQAERQIAGEHDQPRRPSLDQLERLARQDRDGDGRVPVRARHQHGADEGDQESHRAQCTPRLAGVEAYQPPANSTPLSRNSRFG